MDDLISREAAIDAIDELVSTMSVCVSMEECKGMNWMKRRAIAAIRELPTAAGPKWIPVSEGLPEEDRNVLVSVHFLGLEIKHKTGWNDHIKESWYVDIASQIDGEWTSASDEYKVAKKRHIVTAWMPLPEPWKGEENGRNTGI